MIAPCDICGCPRDDERAVCAGCRAVAELVAISSEQLHLIVDGSYKDGRGGAGLVLVEGSVRGEVVAYCGCKYQCQSPSQAETIAVQRGQRWAPGVRTWTDSEAALRHGEDVHFIHPDFRQPNHALAHRLSVAGRRELEPCDDIGKLTLRDRSVAAKARQLVSVLGRGADDFARASQIANSLAGVAAGALYWDRVLADLEWRMLAWRRADRP
jgi:hypothetical protein